MEEIMKRCIYNVLGFGLLAILIVSLVVECIKINTPASAVASRQIHVNQVGYLPEYPKAAIVAADECADEFKVINADTKEVVFSGTLSAPQQDSSSGDTVRKADFSAITTPGTYIVAVEGIDDSYKFKIADNVYYIPFIHTLRAFTLARCNAAMNDPITGLSIGIAHENYKKARVFFTDDVSTKGDVIDVSGGWYDAGDYGKYTPTGSITVANILLAYENQPGKFTKGQMVLPEGLALFETNMPDVLVEMKYELDWMLKMQRSDGNVYLKTSAMSWPSLETSPEKDIQDCFVFGYATYNTAMFGAVNAMAARIYEKYDPAFADKLLTASKKAYDYLAAHPEAVFHFDQGQNDGSGPYDKASENEEKIWLADVKKDNPDLNIPSDTGERIWLAAELYKTTGDKKYEDYIQDSFKTILTLTPKAFSWVDTLALGQWAYITNEKANNQLKAQVKSAFLRYADNTVKQVVNDGYGCALRSNEYTWSSSKVAAAKGNMLTLAYQLEPNKEYQYAALEQVHYILGRNTNGTSYLTGEGTKPALHPHSRIHRSKGTYIPGQLVGGPNNWPGGDSVQTKYLLRAKVYPAKAYFDVFKSYSTNEYAIDYIAPAAYILAYFSKPNNNITPEELKVLGL